jgi:hypothetical protein
VVYGLGFIDWQGAFHALPITMEMSTKPWLVVEMIGLWRNFLGA